jgi:hypothetical protein
MSVRKFQNGDVVVVTDKVSKWSQDYHKLVPGMSGVVQRYDHGGYYSVKIDNGTANGVVVTDKSKAFEKGTPKTSVERFEEQIAKAKEKIQATKAFIAETEGKITFMKETGSDTFDENEFKAYHTLMIIEKSGMTMIEKAKAIATLISSK